MEDLGFELRHLWLTPTPRSFLSQDTLGTVHMPFREPLSVSEVGTNDEAYLSSWA